MLCILLNPSPDPSAKSKMSQWTDWLHHMRNLSENHTSLEGHTPGHSLSKAAQLLPKDDSATAFKHMMQDVCCEKPPLTI